MVAVRLQSYNIANSPNTLPGIMVLRYLPSRDTSTLPSIKNESLELINRNIHFHFICYVLVHFQLIKSYLEYIFQLA